MKKWHFCFLIFNCLVINALFAQNAILEGYVFEEKNRGFLNEVRVVILDTNSSTEVANVYSNTDGFFTCELPINGNYLIQATKDIFEPAEKALTTKGKAAGEKVFTKIEMKRQPGYLLDITLADARISDEVEEVDAIEGALIEIYDNTAQQEALVLKSHPFPTFQYTIEQGKHYTIMIRKEGYFTKRIEAYVNVDGCILCMDGVSNIGPGVSENLTAKNTMGTLLANISLEKAEINQTMQIENIYYDYNKSNIRTDAAIELDKLIDLLQQNPTMIVELGSHTDARGKNEYNRKLSQSRAEEAVAYIIENGEIDASRISAKGYGETKLTNRCADGVKCSDEEHQKNRRTELKIVGFQSENLEMQKSLRQIIKEERMEQLLEEVLQQEVVEIPENYTPSPSENIPTPAGQETIIETSKSASNSAQETTSSSSETRIITETPVNRIEDKMPERRDPFSGEPAANPNSTTTTTSTDGILIRSQEEVSNSNLAVAKSLPAAYSGYTVEFWTASEPLEENHRIFTQHGNILMDVIDGQIFSYMLGQYDNMEDAQTFLKEVISQRYPDARVVQYDLGNRLN